MRQITGRTNRIIWFCDPTKLGLCFKKVSDLSDREDHSSPVSPSPQGCICKHVTGLIVYLITNDETAKGVAQRVETYVTDAASGMVVLVVVVSVYRVLDFLDMPQERDIERIVP